MPDPNVLRDLAEVLRSGSVQPIVSPDRVAPSTVYDIEYRTAVTACAFDLHARLDSSGTRRIQAIRLKLLQFLAIRPWLIPVLQRWANTQADPQLSVIASQERRGFLGDTVHDHVVEYLVARQILAKSTSHLSLGTNGAILEKLSRALTSTGLFENERAALTEMKDIKVTNTMLEGW
jgi:hypothetical protein